MIKKLSMQRLYELIFENIPSNDGKITLQDVQKKGLNGNLVKHFGYDSLSIIELEMEMEKETGIFIDDKKFQENYYKKTTVESIVSYENPTVGTIVENINSFN